MENLNQKAAFYQIGLQIGVHTITDVIKWVDTEISKSDSPNELLLELSLMKDSNIHDVLHKLNKLSSSSDTIKALCFVLAAMYPVLKSNAEYGPIFARGLEQMCIELNYNVPDDLSPMYGISDEYSLAKQGTYGTEEEVYKGFLNFLEPFSEQYL